MSDRLNRFRQKIRSRLSSPKPNVGTSRPTSSNSSRPTPTPTPTQPEPNPRPTQPTSITPPAPPGIEDIRRQIWNEAYDKVKHDEPDAVDAYEKILSAQLAARNAVPSVDRNTTNVIGENAEARQAQIKTLVKGGLGKTEKEAKIKEKFKERIQPVNNVKDFVSIAVKSEPSAAVAWLGVTTLIDLIANPLTEPGINRDGIKYVLERVEWYWELAQLLLDPGKVDDSIVGLQSLLRGHVIKLYKKLLLYQMQSVCLYNKHWAAVIVRDLFKADGRHARSAHSNAGFHHRHSSSVEWTIGKAPHAKFLSCFHRHASQELCPDGYRTRGTSCQWKHIVLPVAFAACHDESLWGRVQELAGRELNGRKEYVSWLGRKHSKLVCGREMTNAMAVFNLVLGWRVG